MLCSEEFAHQLAYMYGNLPIEAKNRNYVSKWLVTVLSDEESRSATADEFPIITKKIRDEVLGQPKKDFFRRSSFYMGIKALLQHNLTVQLGAQLGRLAYKITMLKFLIQICDFYLHPTCITIDIELVSEMIAKMARRIEKLGSLVSDLSCDMNSMKSLYEDTVQQAKHAIGRIRVKIDNQIDTKIATKTKLPPLADLNCNHDIIQKMPKLKEYLQKRTEDVAAEENRRSNYQVKSYSRFFKHQRPGTESISVGKDPLGERVFWLEFENMALYEMKMDDQRWTVDALRTWSDAYATFAESNYNGNQLFGSRMILVRLKMILMLDRIATTQHPLLLKHQSGINPNIIASLLLPQRIDMQIAYELEQYFGQRNRNASVMGPSLIGEQAPTQYSFSSKYAQQSPDMLNVRRGILAADEANLAEKKDEWEKGRERAESLRAQANRLSCKYYYCRYSGKSHSSGCEKCRLKRQANGIEIMQYEHLMPKDIPMQYAIVFELRIPKEIAYLRDTLYTFVKYFHSNLNSLNKKFDWTTNRSEISHYNQSHSAKVRLGSGIKSTLSTHHVDFSFDMFDRENTSNCLFYGDHNNEIPTSFADNAIKSACTFRTQGVYTNLEWALKTTMHTQNQVLALQSKCPQELSLSEWINYGSLRADGHRLQLRKLYAIIETEALSFECESVLSLIMQTLWECGISGDAADIRESHIDFSKPAFCSETIQLLEKFVGQQKSNWKHPFKLLMAVLIAVRIFEINSDAQVADEIVGFSNIARSIVLDWIDSIGAAIHEMENPDEQIERELRLKLIYVAIAGALTFFVHPAHEHYERIFSVDFNNASEYEEYAYGMVDMTAPRLWLQFIITMKNNILMYTSNESSLPSNLRMFLRLVESIGVRLERSITMIIQQNPAATVNGLIKKQWTRAEGGSFLTTEFHLKFPQMLTVETMLGLDTQIVSIDIIAGIFLVDGLPVCRLPHEIMQSQMYRWFFTDVAFEVQPDAQLNYSTVQRYNGCSYEFKMNGNQIRIIERTVDGVEKELVPYEKFADDFPFLLVNGYSHWWNKSSERIEFRKRTIGRKHFSKETSIDYELKLDEKLLIHMKTQRHLLDINTTSYENIVQQLARLEHSNYIHVLMDTPEVAKVELMRMNLKFKVDAGNGSPEHVWELESNEFSGMRVSLIQNIGTLYGLQHGLLLESSSDAQNRILLIPNGHIHCNRTKSHVSVSIDTQKALQSPPFFKVTHIK